MSQVEFHRKVRDIAEGNYHSVHASNKAEKFKLSKLAQGIESCRQAQVLKFRKEEKELLKTLDKFEREKSVHSFHNVKSQRSVASSDLESSNSRWKSGLRSRKSIVSSGAKSQKSLYSSMVSSTTSLFIPTDQRELEDGNESPVRRKLVKESTPQSDVKIIFTEYLVDENLRGKEGTDISINLEEVIEEKEDDDDTEHGSQEHVLHRTESHHLASLYEGDTIVLEDGSVKQEEDKSGDRNSSTANTFRENRIGSAASNFTPNLNRLAERKSPIMKTNEVVPFYLRKKYDHHDDEDFQLQTSSSRFGNRRNALTVDDAVYEANKGERRRRSADLGTITFKSNVVTEKPDTTKSRRRFSFNNSTERRQTSNNGNGYQYFSDTKRRFSEGPSDMRQSSHTIARRFSVAQSDAIIPSDGSRHSLGVAHRPVSGRPSISSFSERRLSPRDTVDSSSSRHGTTLSPQMSPGRRQRRATLFWDPRSHGHLQQAFNTQRRHTVGDVGTAGQMIQDRKKLKVNLIIFSLILKRKSLKGRASK